MTEAEAAEFRACCRCDPKGDRAAVARAVAEDACAFMERAETMPSLEALAGRAGVSRGYFLRVFRDQTGLTPRSYAEGVWARRLQASWAGGARVLQAAADAGGGSESRVCPKPEAPRQGGAGEVIRTAFTGCSFGRLLVGATDRGVCFLGFAEPDDALMGDLRRRFPLAVMEQDDGGLAAVLGHVLAFLQEPSAGLMLALDLHGTAFQRRVWAALCRIPAGETRTYGEVAGMIGAPLAVRAVARSCAVNPVSLAVPCHRVVGKDGDLTGYRWGVPRKKALLARERDVSGR